MKGRWQGREEWLTGRSRDEPCGSKSEGERIDGGRIRSLESIWNQKVLG